MTDQPEPHIGSRIRMIREQRKISLRALAEQCKLSANAISLIERGENSPTVSSLQALATALGVRITDFFEESHEQAVVLVRRNQRMGAQGNGLIMESLGSGLQNQQLEPFLVTVDPGTEDTGDPIVHPGQEFVHCLEGEIQYQIGDQIYCLSPGDSLLFEATQPHYFLNTGRQSARMLLIFQAIEGAYLARQRHLEN